MRLPEPFFEGYLKMSAKKLANQPQLFYRNKDFYIEVFLHQDRKWHHCKTWVSRQCFFAGNG